MPVPDPTGAFRRRDQSAFRPAETSLSSFLPDSGYTIDRVLVDGASVGAVSSYFFTNVNADHTIEAQFISGAAAP